MAEVILKDENVIEVNLAPEEAVETEVYDINYIPGYAVAEKERREYYEDFKQRVNAGEFNGQDGKDGKDGLNGKDGADGLNGKDGEKGDKGDPGEKGEKGDPGEKGEPGAIQDLSNYYTKSEVDNVVGNINAVLSTLTTVSEVE
jgi:hypothetical protein